ncbi:MAG: PQQ-binding-like beta-propeller repeat protein [Chloroflexota bacterium]
MTKLSRLLPIGLVVALITSASSTAPLSLLDESTAAAFQSPVQSAIPSPVTADTAISVRSLGVGIEGTITSDILTADLNGDGEEATLLGTSRGLYILSRGTLLQHIPTSSSVMDVALLDDVTGDGQLEVVLAVGDTYFPNIRVYSTATGDKVWHSVPTQEVFIENLMWTDQQTLTFDIEAVDVNSDGIKDVIANSGYRVYALDGRTGSSLWDFEAGDNLWRVAATEDLNRDGIPDLAVGGQNGSLYALSGKEGTLLWQMKLVAKYDVIKGQGSRGGKVDRSVWDIVPVSLLGAPWAVVSSEDGYVRLVDLREGTVQWELQVIEYVDALLTRYYGSKSMRTSSPGDFHFFNLRLALTPDVTGDDVEEILASAYLGRRQGQQGQEPRGAGLFLINPATGRTLWKNTSLEMENVARMETTTLEGEPVILLPSGSMQVIDLQDGEPIQDDSSSEGSFESWYAVKELASGEILLASSYGDLVCVSSSGEVLWDYPGMTQVAVERGDFTGDETQDILIRSEIYRQDPEPRARVLYVLDGATEERAWSYVMPYEEFATTGGIGGIQVAPDLNQDGKQDIIGFIQPPGERPEPGKGDYEPQLMVISGKDGLVLLKQPVVTQTYYGLWEGLYSDPSIIEQGIIRQHEMEMETRFPEEWARQEQQMRDDFEQQQLPDQWNRYQEDMSNQFNDQLQADLEELRGDGRPEEELADYEQTARDDFEQQLQEERADWERDQRDNFEQQLVDQKAEQERGWREGLNEKELSDQLEQWQERLDNEEKGRRIDKSINSLDVIRDANAEEGEIGVALVVGGSRDIFIVSPTGELLWTRTHEPWTYQDPFTGEEAPEMVLDLQLEDSWSSIYRVPGDLNGDGIDDLVIFSYQEIVMALSTMEDDGLGFERGPSIKFEQGIDLWQVRLVDDLDGDGVRDIFYPRHQEGKQPTGIFVSTATGKELLKMENMDGGNVALDLASADLDGDGNVDTLLFRRWAEGREGPLLQVLSGRGGSILWENGYEEGIRDLPEPNGGGGGGYQEGSLPAAPISDITGDGIADLALVKNLTWQAGAKVVLYDVAHNVIVKEIVLEEIGTGGNQEERWQPGLLVGEVGDVNGDDLAELAVITALGESEQAKEFRLMVVDIHQEQVLADFRLTGSKLLDLGHGSRFGVVGMVGEVYLVDVANDLNITSPAVGSTQASPLTVQWTGVAIGTFNQVLIDGVEIARTNENEFTTSVAQGEHQVTIRSLDEYGRGIYRTADFTVEKGSSAVTVAIGMTMMLFAVALWFPLSGFVTTYRRRKKQHG